MAGRKNAERLIPETMKFLLCRKFVFFFIPYLILYLLSAHNALFWDTLQFAGDHPTWYYDTGFRYLLLPDACDSGHPPAFGMYLASLWKLAGRSLWVSHTAMLPFILLLVVQAIRTGELLFPQQKRYAFWATLIVLTESVLLTQCTLVSPDICLMAFFLLALNAILSRSHGQLAVAVLLMAILSNRAIMVAFVLYLFRLSYDRQFVLAYGGRLRYLLRQVLPFLPGALVAIAYFSYHYYVKGWIGAPKDSRWSAGFEIVPPGRMALNFLVLGWRLVDLGKVVTFLVSVYLLVQWLRKKIIVPDDRRVLVISFAWLLAGLLVFTALPLALYQGLLTHRYFLPVTTVIALLVVLLLAVAPLKRKGLIFGLMVLVQLSGHFWTYPRSVSQGWEGTLGHLYFYGMREDFLAYMQQQGIGKDQVASSSTLMQSGRKIDLTNDTTAFRDFEKDTVQYVWYCNVSNAMNRTVGYYFKHYEIVKKEKKGHVEMILFRNPAYPQRLP